jgi:hypothetical protein
VQEHLFNSTPVTFGTTDISPQMNAEKAFFNSTPIRFDDRTETGSADEPATTERAGVLRQGFVRLPGQ